MAEEYLPPIYLVVLAVLLSISRFENQRWVRARAQGMRGSNQTVGLLVDLTGGLAMIFALGFLGAVAYDFGIIKAVALFGVTLVAGMLVSAIVPDNFVVWIVGTVMTWVFAVLLASEVTWFGLV